MQVFFQRSGKTSAAAVRVKSMTHLAIAARTQLSLIFPYNARRYGSFHQLPARIILPSVKSFPKYRNFSGFNHKSNDPRTSLNQHWDQQRQNEAPVVRKGWSRATKIFLGIFVFIILNIVMLLLWVSYAVGKLFAEISYKKKLYDAFNALDEDHDGLITIDDLYTKWRQIQKEVSSWKPKDCEDEFRKSWARVVAIGDKTLGDCIDNNLDIFQFSDLVAAVLFNASNVDRQDFITEEELRAIANTIPDVKTTDVDKIIGLIFSEFDLDGDGRITLEDVQFRLRAELETDSSQS